MATGRYLGADLVSGKNFVRYLTCDIGKAEVTSIVAIGEALMVEAHEGEQGGVEVIDVHAPLHSLDTKLIGAAMGVASLQSSTCKEHGVAGDVVIAAIGSLGCGLAAKLRAEEHERLIQQAAIFEIGE